MKEIEFKAAVDGLWEGFRRSAAMVGILEGVGLLVEMDTSKPGLHMLYAIQDMVPRVIVTMLGIKDPRLLEELDSFLLESADRYKDTDGLPEEVYGGILDTVRAYGHKLPWEPAKLLRTDDRTVKHRAVSKKDGTPVTGYIWEGMEHAYIIPQNAGIGYDEETQTLTAKAVEVDKDTIAASLRVMDDRMTVLYEGDAVRTGWRGQEGSAEYVVRNMDMDTMELLAGRRNEKGLYFVKHNYE